MSYELLIQHGSNIMYPPTVEGVTIEWERKGQPGKLTFEVVKTPGLSFQEGDPCRFSVDGTPVFYGFVFEKSRKGNNPNVIKCVVYDQLYSLKNKDTYVYTNKTASEVIKMVAEDFQLNVGVYITCRARTVEYIEFYVLSLAERIAVLVNANTEISFRNLAQGCQTRLESLFVAFEFYLKVGCERHVAEGRNENCLRLGVGSCGHSIRQLVDVSEETSLKQRLLDSLTV